MQKQINDVCQKIIEGLSDLIENSDRLIIAIDGNCASGKTTVAKQLSSDLSTDVIHMDDFYLPMKLRTKEQMEKLGGNIDFQRMVSEVFIPLSKGEEYIYKPYSCKTNSFAQQLNVIPKRITIVEGSYSCHPCLDHYYNYRVFLSANIDDQIKRITDRNGEMKASQFMSVWIPRENQYFEAFKIKDKCDLII